MDFLADSNVAVAHPEIYDFARWRAHWRCEKFHRKDVEDLDYVLEYTDGDLRRHESKVLKGQTEAKRFLERLLRTDPGVDDPTLLGRAGYFRPRMVGIDTPDEVVEYHRNLLMYGGVSCIWQCLIGNGTTTAGQSLTYFSNAQAAVGVGDSSTAAAATQTNLQAASNKLRKAMDATFPSHTDGTTSAANTVSYKSTFATGEANFAWQEVGVFNSATDAVGRMVNRLVQSFGSKVSGSWSMQLNLSIA